MGIFDRLFHDFYTIKPFWRGAGAGAAVRVRRAGAVRVRRGSVSSASACCKAGPS